MEQGPGSFRSFGRAPGFASAVAVLLPFMIHKRGQELPLLDTHEAFVELGMFFKILCGLFRLVMVLRIIEHGSTHTVLPFFTHEDLVVDTAFAAGPEGLIL